MEEGEVLTEVVIPTALDQKSAVAFDFEKPRIAGRRDWGTNEIDLRFPIFLFRIPLLLSRLTRF